MSEKICEELKALLKGSQFNPIVGLTANELETIRQKSKELSFAEKAELFINFSTYPGTLLYDAGSLFEAQIKIDDTNSKNRSRPLAYIKFSDGYRASIEVIDILESVRNDATLIGHPAILFAINYWQKILIWARYIKQRDIYDEAEAADEKKKNKKLKFQLSGQFVENAQRYLDAIGAALLEGARRKSIPKESALDLQIHSLNIDAKNTYLYVAWERLAVRHIKEKEESEERVRRIENFLRQLPFDVTLEELSEFAPEMQQYGIIEPDITISNVINFLKADGKKFVFNKTDHKSQRPRWKVFRNAFTQWYFNKKPSTVEEYRKKAKKQGLTEPPYKPSIFGTLPETNVFQFLMELFTSPLAKISPTIECSEIEADLFRFQDLTDQKDTK